MQKIELKDYRAPEFAVEKLDLSFDLYEDFCRVKSALRAKRTSGSTGQPWILDGVGLELESIHLDGAPLSPSRYRVTAQTLELLTPPDEFALEIVVKNRPQDNTSLEGLYKSQGLFTTQCEAQGFRKVTYFPDRPDVMTTFTVTIEADQKKYPVLLSNGDRVRTQTLNNGRHAVTWKDPHKKPCYLFALVAGDLGVLRDQFVTQSGRSVALEIYAAHGAQDRCHFAMESLKRAMKWDEERFGREYDLDTYMIVAVDDFNAGAMENKGLNIFNSRLVLADSASATDKNYFDIESVVAHEYFHNWTGNRVTLRDWFHLSLKEGLTVFRDQEFSMDLHSRPMVRIDTVADLRDSQFSEDAGPNAHPIRPESCYAVDNFFTSTIYEKGSEVIRMMQTMVGRPGFRKGMDLYFERHDGQAVIIEDFAAAISEPNQQDWSQFKRWYSQAGTPRVKVQTQYDAPQKTFTVELEQSCPPTPEQPRKEPFHIPLVVGLLGSAGQDLALKADRLAINSEGQTLIHLREPRETYVFREVTERPVLSINRGFSAPIRLESEGSQDDLLFQLAHDTDSFNRWDAAQTLLTKDLSRLIEAHANGREAAPSEALLEALGRALKDEKLDVSLRAKLLVLPGDAELAQSEPVLKAESFEAARLRWTRAFAQHFEKDLVRVYETYHGKNDQSLHHTHMAERRLKNVALGYLSLLPSHADRVWSQFERAAHMTDLESAFTMCLDLPTDHRERATKRFFELWKQDSLTLNKWFAAQALSRHPATAQVVQALWGHPEFNAKNPNRVYSLLARFGDNLVRFHERDGENYAWFARKVLELDRMNPQVATRVAGSFDLCANGTPIGREKARQALDAILSQNLSKNTFEIVGKTRESLAEKSGN